jgi:hypothetical protein
MKIFGAMFLAALVSCVTVRPEDMSAQEHRAEAAADRAQAAREEAQFDPNQTVSGPATTGRITPWPEVAYNPTASHLSAAWSLRAHAAAHERAAKQLERFEEAECAAFAAPTRAECPLLTQVSSLEDIPDGVRLHLVPGAQRDVVMAHFRCHYAFALAQGFSDLPPCPLYVKGLRIAPGPAADSIDLTAAGSGPVAELRKRFEEIVSTQPTPRQAEAP